MRCGFVGLLGLPNAGKSTFLNHIIGEKISIVSDKPQTTRNLVSGILTDSDSQLVFYDAPGFIDGKDGLWAFLNKEFHRVAEESEVLVLVISCDQKSNPEFSFFMEQVEALEKDYVVLFSKADLPPSELCKELEERFKLKNIPFIFFQKNQKDNAELDLFLKSLSDRFPEQSQPFYDPEMISLQNTRDIVGEMIREQCFETLHQEIPFGLGVIIKSFNEKGKILRIEANIVVDKENHKGIVIGEGGRQLKEIGTRAQKRIEEFLDQKIFLGLHVAYKKNWTHKPQIMSELGYGNKS